MLANRRAPVFSCSLLVSSLAIAQRARPQTEQTHFSAEAEGVDHPVAMPDDVLKMLEEDDFVRSALQDADPPARKAPPSWFSAAEVHLGKGRERDLIVLGKGPLTGANVIMFWIFRNTAHGHDLVLRTGGHDLETRRHRSNGYRDIETGSVTMMHANSQIFRFDGKRYITAREDQDPTK